MAQIPYRANLSAAIFPMTLARAGRSVIIPGADNNFDRRVDPAGEQTDAGIPQVIYGENILPTEQGYQSVGYTAGGSSYVSSGVIRPTIALSIPGAGHKIFNLVFEASRVLGNWRGFWQEIVISGTYPASPSSMRISYGVVGSTCYLQISDELYTVTFNGGTDQVTLTNITATVTPAGFMTGVNNICGSFGYLVAIKAGVAYWSSTLSAIDFNPSLITGSSSGMPANLVSTALFLRASPAGFYVICRGNIVHASYTGNARYPWRFLPIAGTEGAELPEHISGDPISQAYIVLDPSGNLTSITPSGAERIGEQLAELVNRITYADRFSYANNTFSVVNYTSSYPSHKVTFLLDRYIFLSRKAGEDNTYRDVYVYDLAFGRYGKLNLLHTSIVEVTSNFSPTRRELNLLNTLDGSNKLLKTDVNNDYASMQGVIVIGKIQYVRSRFLCLDEVSAESTHLFPADITSRNFQAYALPTLDGKTFLPALPLFLDTIRSGSQVMNYFSSAEGKNISLMFKGAFDLSSVEMKFHLGGKY